MLGVSGAVQGVGDLLTIDGTRGFAIIGSDRQFSSAITHRLKISNISSNV